MTNKENTEKELIYNLRKEYYMYNLDTIGGCQRLLIELIKQNRGHIIENRIYHLLNEKCQDMIFEAEKQGKDIMKYKEMQDRIENLVDKKNEPEISTKTLERKGIINIIMKNRDYKPRVYKVDRKGIGSSRIGMEY